MHNQFGNNKSGKSCPSTPDLDDNMQQIMKATENILNDDYDDSKYVNKKQSVQAPNGNYGNIQSSNSQCTSEPQNNNGKAQDNQSYQLFYAKSPIFMENASFVSVESTPEKKPLTQGDRLRTVMNDQNIRKAIVDLIGQHGIQISVPILKLQVNSNTNYDLEEADIRDVFARFGKVLNVVVKPNGKAFVVFQDIISALFAQKSLNGHYIQEIDVRLNVSWCHSIEESDDSQPNLMEELSKIPPSSYTIPWNKENTGDGNMRSFPNMPPGLHVMSIIPVKYTCKYEIQIENDREFQVARKIIGAKGCNMKKIIEICQKRIKNPDVIFQPDFLKLRLRGKGSGFKEGPEQKESEDPLHLCVSSKYFEVYGLACKCVEELLTNIYVEYRMYCQKTGRRADANLKIKRIEAFTKTDTTSPSPISPTQNPEKAFECFTQQFDQLLEINDIRIKNGEEKKIEPTTQLLYPHLQANGDQKQSKLPEDCFTGYYNENFRDLLGQRGINIVDDKGNKKNPEPLGWKNFKN